jgi:catechol 2,3-dioxygenase-like lactoylglutathione lyase family enzyme
MMENFLFTGIDHVQLAAPKGCELEARIFFGQLLGWQELVKPEPLQQRGGVWFLCGQHEVHIGVQNDFVPATKAHPGFSVVNLYSLRQRLLGHGIAIIDDDTRAEQGVQRFFVNDPFGNRLEFLEQS